MNAFRNDAQAYCDFVETWRASGVEEPFTTLLRLLSSLAKTGVVIPFDMAEKDVRDVERIDHARWAAMARRIDEMTHAARDELIKEHTADPDAQVRVSMLWDDLADIYRDLRNGLDLYAAGDPDHIAEAIWQWRFGYESHWGTHLFRALTTVHEIRYRLFWK